MITGRSGTARSSNSRVATAGGAVPKSASNNHLVVRMSGGERFDLLDQRVGIIRRDAEFGRRWIDAVQQQGAELHVRMGTGNARNRGFAVQVNHFRPSLPPRQDF